MLAPAYFAKTGRRNAGAHRHAGIRVEYMLNVIAVVTLKWNGMLQYPGANVLLALATASGAILNAWLLYRGLRRQNVYQPSTGWTSMLIRIVLATAVMALVLRYFSGDVDAWVVLHTFKRVLWLAELVMGGIAVYFTSLWLLGVASSRFKH